MLANIKMLFNWRNTAVKFIDDYGFIILEAKKKNSKGEGLKILIPKQMLQRLQILLVQVKAGNTPENLLNKIHQLIYSLYQAEENIKKVDNNIMN